MLYHASPVQGITTLKPSASNHGKPLVYFSEKRENVLFYLSNAIEKHCKETGFLHKGPYRKWASYGFNKNGVAVLEEYYPNATLDTYRGVSGYIYTAEYTPDIRALSNITFAYCSEKPVAVCGCDYIEDAYEAIISAVNDGRLILRKYEENSEKMLKWIEQIIKKEYSEAQNNPEYKFFLEAKFPFVK